MVTEKKEMEKVYRRWCTVKRVGCVKYSNDVLNE